MDQLDENLFKRNKHFLLGYSRMKKRIERLEQKLLELDDRLYNARTSTISDMPRGGVPVTFDDLVARKEDTQERVNYLTEKARTIRREIYSVLDLLDDDRHVEVLELYFIDGLSHEDIADEIGYSTRHIIRLYVEAVKSISLIRN
ncbi:MAG TPA: sigma factor-like helix-turn-helix DNA-binding protein [Cerasibacillus sp.]|uniref:sigma factor-like helix-turn-helix DNA-binding protein n=1 Tax=Cerasibacillus sp. TaxID=2498711 RepID=UPI002F411E32